MTYTKEQVDKLIAQARADGIEYQKDLQRSSDLYCYGMKLAKQEAYEHCAKLVETLEIDCAKDLK